VPAVGYPEMSKPNLLLFDLGGVLIENAVFDSLRNLLKAPVSDTVLRQRWLSSSAVRRFETGTISPNEFSVFFIEEWRINLTAEAFLKEFISWPKGFYPYAKQTLDLLRKKYRIGCLSNSNELHWEKFNGFNNEFDIAISSHIIGVVKPDKPAFRKALEICDALPEDVCFFDDSLSNVQAAREIGMRSYLVDGFNSLYSILARQGLIIS
jgi:putative hydrolase of the HAD superfamily